MKGRCLQGSLARMVNVDDLSIYLSCHIGFFFVIIICLRSVPHSYYDSTYSAQTQCMAHSDGHPQASVRRPEYQFMSVAHLQHLIQFWSSSLLVFVQ